MNYLIIFFIIAICIVGFYFFYKRNISNLKNNYDTKIRTLTDTIEENNKKNDEILEKHESNHNIKLLEKQTHIIQLENKQKEQKEMYEKRLKYTSRGSVNFSEIHTHELLLKQIQRPELKAKFKQVYLNVLLPVDKHYRQIDHLIITSKFILAIETKNWSGTNFLGGTFEDFDFLKKIEIEENFKFPKILNVKKEDTESSIDGEKTTTVSISFYKDPFLQVRGVSQAIRNVYNKQFDKNIRVYNSVYIYETPKTKNVILNNLSEAEANFTTIATSANELTKHINKLFQLDEHYSEQDIEDIKSIFSVL